MTPNHFSIKFNKVNVSNINISIMYDNKVIKWNINYSEYFVKIR